MVMRISPQLLGIVSQNAGGFGSIREAGGVYALNEVVPIQRRMLAVNDWVGHDVIRFGELDLANENAK